MDADLGRQLGIGDERGQRPLGEPQALVEVGHRGEHIGRATGSAAAARSSCGIDRESTRAAMA